MKEGWQNSRLGKVCSIDKNQGNHADLPYVGLEDIEPETARLVGPVQSQTVKSTTFRFSEQHVLYGRLRPYLNKVFSPGFDGHCSTEIMPIKPGPRLNRHYLVYWLLSEQTVARINATCTGTRMPRANMAAVMSFDFPIPPLDEQQRIVRVLVEAFDAIAAAKANAELNLANAEALFESRLNSIVANRGPGWAEVKIDEVIRFIDYRGKTPAKTSSGLRLITAKNVKMGFLQREPEEFVAPSSYDSWMTRGIPSKGDVLFTTEAPLANVAQLDTEDKVVFAQRIIVMQPEPKKLDTTFLKYLLLSGPIQKLIHAQGTGATATGIKASLLKLIPICFPSSLSEQLNLVATLDSLSKQTKRLESLYTRKLTALDELKQSLLHQAFAGEL